MAYFFVFFGAILRIISHFDTHPLIQPIAQFLPTLPNFAPIAAMALFGGTYLNKKYALILPLVAMFVSDLFIGFYSPIIMISVYGSFLLIGFVGLWLKNHKTVPNVIGASLASSIIFFLITNFAMWAKPVSLYPHTFQGLLDCYIMGLPFFRNTIAGDLFYVGLMFGLMEVAVYVTSRLAQRGTVKVH